DLRDCRGDRPRENGGAATEIQDALSSPLLFIPGLQGLYDRVVVTLERFERIVGHTLREQARRRTEEGIATHDSVLEKGERLSRLDRFHPETDLAQLNCHLIDIDTVDALPDYVP